MKMEIKRVPKSEWKKIIGDVPQTSFGKSVPPDVIAIRKELMELEAGEPVEINIGEGEQAEIKQRTEGGRVVGTGKFRTRYPIKAKFETAVKYVNDNSKDGSKLYIIKAEGSHHIIKISADVLSNKKYHRSRGNRTGRDIVAFDVTQWRRDNG